MLKYVYSLSSDNEYFENKSKILQKLLATKKIVQNIIETYFLTLGINDYSCALKYQILWLYNY
jgi:hypothetical protein